VIAFFSKCQEDNLQKYRLKLLQIAAKYQRGGKIEIFKEKT